MITVVTVSSIYFDLDSIRYGKIFIPLAQGLESISIVQIYDTRLKLVNSTKFDEWTIDGATFNSQAEVIAALLGVIYSPPESGGGGSDELVKVGANGIPNYLNDLFFKVDGANQIKPKIANNKIWVGNSNGIAEEQDVPEGTASINLSWLFSNSLFMSDPTSGKIRFNSADLSAATEVSISDISNQPMDVGAMLANSEGSGLLIQQANDDTKFIVFLIDVVSLQTGYKIFEITEYDSGVIFDDGAELITTYTASLSTGGGHVISDKNNVGYDQEPILQYKGKVEAEEGKTVLIPRFDNSEDVDFDSPSDLDVPVFNSVSQKLENQQGAPFVSILNDSNILDSANKQVFDLEAGYKMEIYALQTSGSSIGLDIGSTSGGADIFTGSVLSDANGSELVLLKTFFSLINDTELYANANSLNEITLYIHKVKVL